MAQEQEIGPDPVATRPRPTSEADGREVCDVDIGCLPDAIALRDWLVDGAVRLPAEEFLGDLAERFVALDVPIDRLSTAIDALHSEYSGIGRIWTRGSGYSYRLFPHGSGTSEAYASSPFAMAHKTRQWVEFDPADIAPESYGIAAELRDEGYTQYICVPLFFTDGSDNGITFATRRAGGFDARARGLLRFVMPTLSAAIEMRSVSTRLDNVLRIYVGDEPRKAILSGAIRRGDVTRIRSAILFADMRGYTRITSAVSPEDAVELLNGFFDCLVPPIESEGGGILKYMGDGLLAIFRDRGDDTGGAAQAALSAAIEALVRLDAANNEGRFPMRVDAGISLHHGEAAYGNVGSGARLDFTVIGPDVNLASRLARMNKVLGEPLLMSRAFANHLWGDPELIGTYDIDGFRDPVPIYRLRRDSVSVAPETAIEFAG